MAAENAELEALREELAILRKERDYYRKLVHELRAKNLEAFDLDETMVLADVVKEPAIDALLEELRRS